MADEPKLQELDKLIAKGKEKGFLTYDEVNDALPSDIVALDQLDDIMMLFGSMDIEVVDSAKVGRLPSEHASQAADPEADDDELLGGRDAELHEVVAHLRADGDERRRMAREPALQEAERFGS